MVFFVIDGYMSFVRVSKDPLHFHLWISSRLQKFYCSRDLFLPLHFSIGWFQTGDMELRHYDANYSIHTIVILSQRKFLCHNVCRRVEIHVSAVVLVLKHCKCSQVCVESHTTEFVCLIYLATDSMKHVSFGSVCMLKNNWTSCLLRQEKGSISLYKDKKNQFTSLTPTWISWR